MNARFPAGNNIRRLQWRKIFQPEACPLCFTMPELPWLNALCEFLIVPYKRLSVFMHDRVFHAYFGDGRIPEIGKKIGALL